MGPSSSLARSDRPLVEFPPCSAEAFAIAILTAVNERSFRAELYYLLHEKKNPFLNCKEKVNGNSQLSSTNFPRTCARPFPSAWASR